MLCRPFVLAIFGVHVKDWAIEAFRYAFVLKFKLIGETVSLFVWASFGNIYLMTFVFVTATRFH